jgi:lysophospholipase L1-like esterase
VMSDSAVVAAAAAIMTIASGLAAAPEPQTPVVRIVLVGDSTVAEDSGWGPGFRRLAASGLEVVNFAANGRSSKSFIDEGLWAKALTARGQYYLIQFGHNDEPGKGPERETDPQTTYRAFMARYVDESRAIAGTPVLVTSLVRRIFGPDGTIKTTQTPYVEVVRALAAEKRVPLVDLHAISLADAEHTGDDVWADLSPRDDKGQIDRTHLNAKGSDVVGRMVAEALVKVVPPLQPLLPLKPGARPAAAPTAAFVGR